MSETKRELEELKEIIATLTTTIKSNSDDKTKQENILSEMQSRMEKLETAKSRKGVFTGDEEDEDKVKDAIKSNAVDAMIHSKSMDDKIVELQSINDDILLVSQITGLPPQQTRTYQKYMETNPFLRKAMYSSGGTNVGTEWVPTGYSPKLYDKVRLSLKCAALHEMIDMPNNPYTSPVILTDTTGYLVSERTGDDDTLTAGYRITASTLGTTSMTLTAKKLGGRIWFSEELSEDSIVPILPTVQKNMVQALAVAIEQAMINGDTTSTHMDLDVTAATDARKAWNGYRDMCQSAAKVSLATFNADTIASVRTAMGKYGVETSELAWICSIGGYMKLLTLRDAQNNATVITLDKYGPQATIKTGELGQLFGSPIIVSEYVRENLNASAVYDGTTTSKTIMLCVYTPAIKLGNRRTLKIKTAEDIHTDQNVLVATLRMACSPVWAAASNYFVGMGYNF
jgi:HK97 family phage major capsid protein